MVKIIATVWGYFKKISWELVLSWFVKDKKLHKLRTIVTMLVLYTFLVLWKKYLNQSYCSDGYALGLISGVIGGIGVDVFNKKKKA